MIKNVDIKNFRCFRDSSFKNFKRINLIGGKNNSGKTAFLEAVFLNTSPSARSVELLRRFRQIDASFMKAMPERAWNNFFFDINNREASIKTETFTEIGNLYLNLSCNELVEDSLQIIAGQNDEDEDDDDSISFQEIRELLSNRESTRSTLYLKYKIDDQKDKSATLIAHKNGVIGKDINIPDVKEVNFIPASLKLSGKALAEEFDKADLNGLGEKVLKAFQIIDPKIISIKTISVGSPSLYLESKGREPLPIGLFGDAIGKISHLVLKIINSKNSILLIDEIENGIHYSAQEGIWEKIFELANEFDVQIFATTHSKEMIDAFVKILSKKYTDQGGYYEFFRHRKTGEITSELHTPNTLVFELENNMAIRGE